MAVLKDDTNKNDKVKRAGWLKGIDLPYYTGLEELLNAVSHGAGALLGAAGLVMLMRRAEGPLAMACALVFGISMILLYSNSCIYHAMPRGTALKKLFRVLDHCNVYLLVFGTYVPGALLGVSGHLGLGLSIAARIAADHGGKVWAAYSDGKLHFYTQLPL